LQNSHVLPALIRKMHEAKLRDDPEVVVWGTGTPRREFLYSDDMADACMYLMNLPDERFFSLLTDDIAPLINVGCGQDQSIHELAKLVKDVVGFGGNLYLIPANLTAPPGNCLMSASLASSDGKLKPNCGKD